MCLIMFIVDCRITLILCFPTNYLLIWKKKTYGPFWFFKVHVFLDCSRPAAYNSALLWHLHDNKRKKTKYPYLLSQVGIVNWTATLCHEEETILANCLSSLGSMMMMWQTRMFRNLSRNSFFMISVTVAVFALKILISRVTFTRSLQHISVTFRRIS